LDDRRTRYLRQQAELGGSEIYLAAPATTIEFAEPEVQPEPAPTVAAIISRVAEPAAPIQREIAAAVPAVTIQPPTVQPRAVEAPPASLPPKEVAAAPVREGPPVSPPGLHMSKAWPKWRKDAPPVPGPGLIITPPAPALMGEDLEKLGSLDAVAGVISTCRKCGLCKGRDQTVPGEGNPNARLMCIGEGPGEKEDRTGRPFVGAAGVLLDQILAAIDCPRETVFIANIVKCRPPQNRKPLPEEALACLPYLHRQIALVRPKVILALGGTAAEWMLGVRKSLGDLRGQVHSYAGIPLVVTYHPAALLRNPNWKRPTWDDVRIARQLLDK
jgi:uracil-DNA glycosylase